VVKEGDPDINIAIATIQTLWPGADPETIENQITDKIETQLKSLKGLKEITSASFDGMSLINVEFQANAPIAESIAQVRAKVDEAKPDLTLEAEEPKVTEVSVQDVPILTIGLYGDIDQAVLSRAAKEIEDLLEKVPNVREVNVGGQRDEVIHVQMMPNKLTALGISPTTVAQAIQRGNIDMPWDQVESDDIGSQVRLYGRFRTLEDLSNLPITRICGSDKCESEDRVVRLGEIAEIRRDLEREKNRAFISFAGAEYQPAINIDVVKVPGSDTIKVVDDCLEAMAMMKQNPSLWPYGMEYQVIATDKDTILRDLNQLFQNGWQGVLCVFLVLLVALTWREAIIAGLSIPLTFLAALAIVWLLGNTLNKMVQVGMILSLGLLVDVFILMMEGMHESLFTEKLTFNQAALKTVRTFAIPALSGQLTTILAMVPLMAIGGLMGKFIRLLPITAIICLSMSYIIALFVDIPLSRYLLDRKSRNVGAQGLRPGAGKREKEKASLVDRLTKIVTTKFTLWLQRFTIPNKFIASLWVCGVIGLFVFSTILVGNVPGTLFPDADKTALSVNVEMPPTATLETSQKVADDLGEILRGKNYFESVVKLVGQRSNLVVESGLKPSEGNYLLGFSVAFVPKEQREKNSFEYLDELRTELNAAVRKYPGASLVVNVKKVGEGGDPIAIEITGTDMDELRRISGEVQMALRGVPGAVDVRDDLGSLRPDIKFQPKREAMDFYGIAANDLAMQGRYLMTDNDIADFPIGGGQDDLEIRLSTAWPSRGGSVGGPTRPDELAMVRLITPNGPIAANQILEQVPGMSPLSITHKNAQRTVTVLAKTKDRTVGEILADLEPKITEMKRQWPIGYNYNFGGEAATTEETFGSAKQMAVVALFLVFAVLVIQFGSFTQPFIIMLAIPFGLIGTFSGFFLLWIPISFPAVIGIISLTGIVVNNSIVMVDTMNTYLKKGMDLREAAARGASDRLRPILSTTLTTIVGVLPMAFSDPMWFPLCMAIAFGLTSSTCIGLFVTPALYLLLTPPEKAHH
jgi:multidrug efflux pump subunit AcrB